MTTHLVPTVSLLTYITWYLCRPRFAQSLYCGANIPTSGYVTTGLPQAHLPASARLFVIFGGEPLFGDYEEPLPRGLVEDGRRSWAGGRW